MTQTPSTPHRERTCSVCGVFIGHVREHPCVYRIEPPLPDEPALSTFSGRNSVEALDNYRKGIR